MKFVEMGQEIRSNLVHTTIRDVFIIFSYNQSSNQQITNLQTFQIESVRRCEPRIPADQELVFRADPHSSKPVGRLRAEAGPGCALEFSASPRSGLLVDQRSGEVYLNSSELADGADRAFVSFSLVFNLFGNVVASFWI